MNQEMDVLTVPHCVAKVDRHLDILLEEELNDVQYRICEVFWKLGLVTRDEIKCRDEDGIITYYSFYISTAELQQLMEDNHQG